MYVKDVIYRGVEWIPLAQDRVHLLNVVNTVMNVWVP
jgi:hypothetical protein